MLVEFSSCLDEPTNFVGQFANLECVFRGYLPLPPAPPPPRFPHIGTLDLRGGWPCPDTSIRSTLLGTIAARGLPHRTFPIRVIVRFLQPTTCVTRIIPLFPPIALALGFESMGGWVAAVIACTPRFPLPTLAFVLTLPRRLGRGLVVHCPNIRPTLSFRGSTSGANLLLRPKWLVQQLNNFFGGQVLGANGVD